MDLAQYIFVETREGENSEQSGKESHGKESGEDSSLEALVSQRTRILNKKLEVLSSEIHERMRIRQNNHLSLIEDELYIGNLIIQLDRSDGYRLVEEPTRERVMLYGRRFDVERERREQDVNCWKDVVAVMRDFLVAWEGREQAQARAIFLKSEDEPRRGFQGLRGGEGE